VKGFLPDVNALLALLDPRHLHHDAAHERYAGQRSVRLILCSHVVNGVIRVASQPRYPNPLGTCAQVRKILQLFVEKVEPGFCGKDVTLLDDEVLVRADELTPSRVGDLYLLALEISSGSSAFRGSAVALSRDWVLTAGHNVDLNDDGLVDARWSDSLHLPETPEMSGHVWEWCWHGVKASIANLCIW